MITAQDIREKTFEKSTFGGYAMNEVDDFLDELANDLTASQKEASVLRGKMKVLVEKIEEYRGSEDAMRKALVSAQKIADDVEAEARAKADAVIAEAEEKAAAILAEAEAKAAAVCGDLEARRAQEELRLQKAQTSAAEFIQTMLAFTDKEQTLLSTLKDLDLSSAIVTPAPAEKKAIAAPVEETVELPAEEAEEDEAKPAYEKAFEEAVYQEEIPAADGEEDPLDFKL